MLLLLQAVSHRHRGATTATATTIHTVVALVLLVRRMREALLLLLVLLLGVVEAVLLRVLRALSALLAPICFFSPRPALNNTARRRGPCHAGLFHPFVRLVHVGGGSGVLLPLAGVGVGVG